MEERKRWEEEIITKVVRKLIELAPDLLERALVESGAMISLLTERHQGDAGEGKRKVSLKRRKKGTY